MPRSRTITPLTDWLLHACVTRNLSWREASQLAGLDKGTISAIVRGAQPGLEVCKGLAECFRVPPEHVLYLAGHLRSDLTAPNSPELAALLREADALPCPARHRVIQAWRAVLDCVRDERASADS